ncbi:MAG: hypothetical protein HY869_08805 [Chloroflexi bacterium]|nr:hypothetical protein [Chloroflexota bacterium]
MRIIYFFLFSAILITACSTSTPLPTATQVKQIQSSSPTPLPSVLFTFTPFPSLAGCVSASNTLRMRSGPGTQFEILNGLPPETCFTVYGFNQDRSWAWINFEGAFGWASTQYLFISGDKSSIPIVPDDVSPYAFSPVGRTLALSKTATPGLILPVAPKKTSTSYTFPNMGVDLCFNTVANEKYVTCKINRAYCSYEPGVSGKPTFCNDAPYPKHHFALVVWGSDWSDLNGYCLLVSGYVKIYDGKPQIIATSRSQVSFCQ